LAVIAVVACSSQRKAARRHRAFAEHQVCTVLRRPTDCAGQEADLIQWEVVVKVFKKMYSCSLLGLATR
jgi:hypothetical protein